MNLQFSAPSTLCVDPKLHVFYYSCLNIFLAFMLRNIFECGNGHLSELAKFSMHVIAMCLVQNTHSVWWGMIFDTFDVDMKNAQCKPISKPKN